MPRSVRCLFSWAGLVYGVLQFPMSQNLFAAASFQAIWCGVSGVRYEQAAELERWGFLTIHSRQLSQFVKAQFPHPTVGDSSSFLRLVCGFHG